MKEVRLGIIGYGNMGSSHPRYFNQIPRLKFTAVADTDPARLEKAAKEYGVKTFATGEELIASGLVDAILIATPHYFHPPLTMAGLKAGLHVLTEKPVSVTAKAAAEVNAFRKKYPKLVYAAMFQQRTVPAYRKVRDIIAGGELGPIQRVNWIITNWFRSQAYYNSGGWRATWGGEGGGVLLNQCPHNLDLFQWICGMPKTVQANIGIGKYHDIEVDDEVTAYLTYPNGATGVFITSTGEAPGTNRLEVTCDKGRLVTDGGSIIEITRTEGSVRELCANTPHSFPKVPADKVTIEIDNKSPGHMGITENFVAAILDGDKLIAPAEEGIHSVELANAMIMSGLTGKTVPVPTDREAYDRLLKKLIKSSKFKKVAAKAAEVDMAASFGK